MGDRMNFSCLLIVIFQSLIYCKMGSVNLNRDEYKFITPNMNNVGDLKEQFSLREDILDEHFAGQDTDTMNNREKRNKHFLANYNRDWITNKRMGSCPPCLLYASDIATNIGYN